MIFIGIIWALQGANILQDSLMSGHSEWIAAGVVCFVLGSALLVFTRIRETNRPAPPPLEDFFDEEE